MRKGHKEGHECTAVGWQKGERGALFRLDTTDADRCQATTPKYLQRKQSVTFTATLFRCCAALRTYIHISYY